MKRKHQASRPGDVRGQIRGIDRAALIHVIGGDVYMHNPRGSNHEQGSGTGE